MDLSDEEVETLIKIFNTFPDEIMLTSSYLAFKFHKFEVLITDEMIVRFAKIRSSRSDKDEWSLLIDKILDFRANAILTIE